MDFFVTVGPFAKVICGFVIMLLGIRLRLGLALSILVGGLFIGISFGLGFLAWGKVAALALVQDRFLMLLAIVGLILILSDGLERSGQSKRLMDALSGYLRHPKLRLIFFPALIGLLPMPGGAVFSAPMVKEVSSRMQLGAERKVVINYWFRHVWEMAWPLYPGIILTVALAQIPVGEFISKTWPGVVAMFVLGWFFYLRGEDFADSGVPDAAGTTPRNVRVALWQAMPLLVAIIGAVGLEAMIVRFVPTIPFELGVIVALVAAICCIMLQNRLGFAFLATVLRKRSLWSMLLVIAAIFIFKDVMGAAGVVKAMSAAAGGRVALFAAAVFLPFLVGMVAGINVAFVGATFPLLIGLLRTLGMEDQMIPYLLLASFSGFTGVMISPIHICFVLTCKFFEASLFASWRQIVAPSVCFGVFGAALFLLYR